MSVTFEPSTHAFLRERIKHPLTVLAGKNNCGKSLLLKRLNADHTQDRQLSPNKINSCYVGTQRIYNFRELPSRTVLPSEIATALENFADHLDKHDETRDDSQIPIDNVLYSLSTGARRKLFEVASDMLDADVHWSNVDPENDMTPKVLRVGHDPLALTSTGARLLIGVLACCFDERFEVLFLDEPELGLYPKLQSRLAAFFIDDEKRLEYMPHLKALFIATHSHLFLHRRDIASNYVVQKVDSTVSCKQVENSSHLHELQFALLGFDLESLYLPTAIVICEGDSDRDFLSRIIKMRWPGKTVTVIAALGDGGVKDRVQKFKETVGDLRQSPYHDRLFPLLDQQNSVSIKSLVRQGIKEDCITVLPKNGIEYCYPTQILMAIFACDEDVVRNANLENDPIEINGKRLTKKALATEVGTRLTPATEYVPELESFLAKLRKAIES